MSETVYSYPLETLSGRPLNLADFKGKKILLVNTASACGYTRQYAQLQELYDNYGQKVQVIGLPCNDFGGQEPGTPEEIAQFCDTNFNVTFPLTAKIKILGPDAHPLYRFLTQKDLNGYGDAEVRWNFWKFLVDENGVLIGEFDSNVEPLAEELLNAIEK